MDREPNLGSLYLLRFKAGCSLAFFSLTLKRTKVFTLASEWTYILFVGAGGLLVWNEAPAIRQKHILGFCYFWQCMEKRERECLFVIIGKALTRKKQQKRIVCTFVNKIQLGSGFRSVLKSARWQKWMEVISTISKGGCSTAVERTPNNREVVGLLSTGCCAFFSFYPL